MAEPNSSASEPDRDATSLTRRDRSRLARTPSARASRPARAPRPPRAPRAKGQTVRSAVIVTMVSGLIATVALPAYAAWQPDAEAVTLQQSSAQDAQSLVVASNASSFTLARESYSATTPEEIDRKKAEEAAAARARMSYSASVTLASIDLNMVAPGSGEVRWPISGYTLGRGLGDSGYHQGVDLLAPQGTPIFAAASGVVRVSQESFGGYGVAITIDHVINGQRVSTLYGHMTYGSRALQAGQTVEAGQLIGLVGSTGSSTANHLHFEVHVNNSVVDPYAWLVANAG